MKKTVSIIGLGWLGLPLYNFLNEKGFTVKGTKTNQQEVVTLRKSNISVFHLDLIPQIVSLDLAEIFDADILVLNIPPDRKRIDAGEFFYDQIKNLLEELCLSKIKHVLFISSTSVYGETEGIKTEESEASPDTSSAEGLFHVEKLLFDQTTFSTTVLRFGGLVGTNRSPAKFLKGNNLKASPNSPINLIHQVDCLQIIEKIIETNSWGQIFNACSDIHPTRKEYYEYMAEKENLAAPNFDMFDYKIGKTISSEKLKTKLDYSFTFPNPFEFTF